MSGWRKTEKTLDDASQGGVADPEPIVDRLVASAVLTLRQEFETAIDKAVSTLKEHFSKELTEAVDDIYARLDQMEQKVSTLEQKPVDSNETNAIDDMKKDIQDAKIIANDTEQYTRRHNIRILGLPSQRANCKETVIDFLKTKLQIRDIDKNDLEAAHPIPNIHTHPKAHADGDGQPVRTEPTIIVRFYSRELRDHVIR